MVRSFAKRQLSFGQGLHDDRQSFSRSSRGRPRYRLSLPALHSYFLLLLLGNYTNYEAFALDVNVNEVQSIDAASRLEPCDKNFPGLEPARMPLYHWCFTESSMIPKWYFGSIADNNSTVPDGANWNKDELAEAEQTCMLKEWTLYSLLTLILLGIVTTSCNIVLFVYRPSRSTAAPKLSAGKGPVVGHTDSEEDTDAVLEDDPMEDGPPKGVAKKKADASTSNAGVAGTSTGGGDNSKRENYGTDGRLVDRSQGTLQYEEEEDEYEQDVAGEEEIAPDEEPADEDAEDDAELYDDQEGGPPDYEPDEAGAEEQEENYAETAKAEAPSTSAKKK
ncbi:unnamed protein product [Amoebophrya sp. A120]|nr:unnamed protein product [Amoebophrya sp. A120]|eukprot:GSA120T00000666001.1